ncbi:MAG: hypothetical protein HYS21_02525 [Deltaproteobacteria bacterium]|nr:hypothetical protein [Deltaproteobacteria bacterium]
MEYDIIEKVVELAVAEHELEGKLVKAAELIAYSFGFDRCEFYLWDEGKQVFTLKAHFGGDSNHKIYAQDEGIPGAVKAQKGVFEAQSLDELEEKGVTDRDMEGFRSVYALPLHDRHNFYGILSLKSRKRLALSIKRRHIIRIVALELSWAIRYDELIRNHQKIHSDLAEIQKKFANAEKLLALGDMAATLAHEIRNPLISIGGFAGRLKKQLGPDTKGALYLDRINIEVSRLQKIMDGITGFLKDSALELRSNDINEVIEECLKIFNPDFRSYGIRVIKDFHKGPLHIMADREQLKIAFDNLIANAVQSMEKNGGSLIIATALSGDLVTISIADNGGGIDPRYLGYIFNPFFTTKEHGTGLGLPITNSIVNRHKGVIEVENNAGVGVTFTVKLPRAEAKLPVVLLTDKIAESGPGKFR